MRALIRLTLTALLSFLCAIAQRPPRTVSPEVHEDRTITFRLRGPELRSVILQANWAGEPKPLAKGEDGVWTVTIGPVKPGIFSYTYEMDGVKNLDPHNPRVKLWLGGPASLVEIPGDSPAFYDVQDVPHGDLHVHYYHSKAAGSTRRAYVYTPPGYEGTRRRYPTLYLLHGSGDNESTWTEVGHANLIFDNLIAAGKVKPMVVVMPNGHPIPWGTRSPRNADLFRQDLTEDLMPFVEGRYRVEKVRRFRAITGLSMGGGESVHTGLGRTDLFSYVGAFSAYVPEPAKNPTVEAFAADAAKANRELRVFWVAIGKDDFLLKGQKEFHAYLEEKGIHHTFQITEGDHSWPVWRGYLSEFAPLLFQKRRIEANGRGEPSTPPEGVRGLRLPITSPRGRPGT